MTDFQGKNPTRPEILVAQPKNQCRQSSEQCLIVIKHAIMVGRKRSRKLDLFQHWHIKLVVLPPSDISNGSTRGVELSREIEKTKWFLSESTETMGLVFLDNLFSGRLNTMSSLSFYAPPVPFRQWWWMHQLWLRLLFVQRGGGRSKAKKILRALLGV